MFKKTRIIYKVKIDPFWLKEEWMISIALDK